MTTVSELRAKCKKKGIKGYSTMTKWELEKALNLPSTVKIFKYKQYLKKEKKPEVEKPEVEKPMVKKPVVKRPVVQKPDVKRPVVQKPDVKISKEQNHFIEKTKSDIWFQKLKKFFNPKKKVQRN